MSLKSLRSPFLLTTTNWPFSVVAVAEKLFLESAAYCFLNNKKEMRKKRNERKERKKKGRGGGHSRHFLDLLVSRESGINLEDGVVGHADQGLGGVLLSILGLGADVRHHNIVIHFLLSGRRKRRRREMVRKEKKREKAKEEKKEKKK